MMKFAILTLLDYKNYGNRWQNYAMNRLLESVGFEIENIYIWSKSDSGNRLKRIIRNILPLHIAYWIQMLRNYKITSIIKLKRVLKFKKFTEKYIPITLILLKRNINISDVIDFSEYDFFAVGSDQIWNPYYVADERFFLTFVEPSKRLALMASFGTNEIPRELEKKYSEWLKSFLYISVREKTAVELVFQLAGKNADLFPDPTLLLDKEEWDKIITAPRIKLPEEYAMSFFFEEIPRDVIEICKEKNVPLLRTNDEKKKELYAVDPQEMLFLIQNAKVVFTDSFHIAALSIKFNKQFYVFNRNKFPYMFTRIHSLLDIFDINNCIYRNKYQIKDWRPISSDKYSTINDILEKEKKHFKDKLLEIARY